MKRAAATPLLVAGVVALATTPAASLPDGHGATPHEARAPKAAPTSRDARAPVPGISSVPTCAFDSSGRLWAAWVDGGHVLVSSSPDTGSSWSRAVPVNPVPAAIDDNGEGRPKIGLGEKGEVFVTYTEQLTAPHSGHVRFSRSVDGGRTFTPPRIVNDDRSVTGHRFDTLVAGPGSRVTIAWLDKSDRDRARAGGRPYAGAALRTAVSLDGGETFLPERKVADNVCECCRVGGTLDGEGRVLLFLRAIFGTRTRDHALVSLDAAGVPGPVRRATFDGWQIDGCPHHGPSIAAAGDGTIHLAWYTGEGRDGRGLFYARTRDGGATVEPPVRLAPAGERASHPAVLAIGRLVYAAWAGPGDGVTRVLARRSADGGETWSGARELGRTSEAADHPFLVRGPRGAVLTWFNDGSGLVVTPLEPWPGD